MIRWFRARMARVQWLNLERRIVELHGPSARALVRECRRDGVSPFDASMEHLDMLLRAHRAETEAKGGVPVADSEPELEVAPVTSIRFTIAKTGPRDPAPYSTPLAKMAHTAKPAPALDVPPLSLAESTPSAVPDPVKIVRPDARLVAALVGLGIPNKEARARALKACEAEPDGDMRNWIALAMRNDK